MEDRAATPAVAEQRGGVPARSGWPAAAGSVQTAASAAASPGSDPGGPSRGSMVRWPLNTELEAEVGDVGVGRRCRRARGPLAASGADADPVAHPRPFVDPGDPRQRQGHDGEDEHRRPRRSEPSSIRPER